MPSRAARRGGRPSSPARRRCAPASPRSACRAPTSACASRTSRSPRRSSRSATPPASSARTIWATATSSCRRCTASTSSSATSITSTPRRSPSTPTIRRTRVSAPSSARAACSSARPPHRRSDRRSALRQGRPADDRGHRAAHQEADGDDRRRDLATRPIDFIQRQATANKPFFCWWNGTRMHLYTHVRPEDRGKSGLSEYVDGMLEHDGHVGKLLKTLDDLGIANNTIVIYGTDNGPHMNSWPDGGMTPFRSEKNTNWEGAFRVPAMIRWPGRIRPGRSPTKSSRRSTGSRRCWRRPATPASRTGCSRAATPGAHLQGAPRRLQPAALLTGQQDKSARKEFFYFNDDGQLVAIRYENWKMVFCEQRVEGTLEIWAEPFVCRRLPKMFNLRMDPYERARHHVEHLLRLDDPARIPDRAGAGRGRAVHRDVQGLPTAAEAFELQRRRGHGQADRQPEGGPPAVGTRAIQ